MNSFFKTLEELLKKDERFVSTDGKIMRNAVFEASNKMDEKLLKLLLSNSDIKKTFFKNINDVLVFDKQQFNFVINNREMLPDSFTRYRQDIGLVDSKDDYISATNDVVLSFPFKDCVLEFDSTDPDQKREEVFFNEVLAHDDKDHLFSPKVFTNAKLIDKKGEKDLKDFDENKNLLIKGNNLIAMHSLLPKFKGKIKLMYWDILYNTDSDHVPYNDSFKHSSWLVMMKNRLEVAKELLRDDGVICIQCDDNEMAYLKVLMDEIFGRDKYLSTLVIENSGALFGTKVAHINRTFIKQKDYITIYTCANNVYINPLYDLIEPYDSHFNKIIISENETYTLLDYLKKNNKVLNIFKKYSMEIKIDNINVLMKIDKQMREIFNKELSPILYQDSPYTLQLSDKELKLLKQNDLVKINGNYIHMTSGGKIRFYKSFKDSLNYADDYKNSYGRVGYRGDLWKGFGDDMGNVGDEGGVLLKNGKKPERLIGNLLKAMTNENDIVLDAYFGTGTTGAVAMKMGRKFIGIEQLDSHFELAKTRLNNVINGDETGISKQVGWKGGGEYQCCELMKLNQNYIEEITKAKNKKTLVDIAKRMFDTGFVSCKVKNDEVKELIENPNNVDFDDIKKVLIEILDKNQLYVNYVDIDDIDFKVSAIDKKFTDSFYK